MKVFRYYTDLFLNFALEYIDISSLDEISKYDIEDDFFIIIIKNKFLIVADNDISYHCMLDYEGINKIIFNFLKYNSWDQTILFNEIEYHVEAIEDHSKCYSI